MPKVLQENYVDHCFLVLDYIHDSKEPKRLISQLNQPKVYLFNLQTPLVELQQVLIPLMIICNETREVE